MAFERYFPFTLLTLLTLATTAQKTTVTTLDGSKVDVNIVSNTVKQKLLQDFSGVRDNGLRKQWTARTFRLSDNRLLIEFYDRQAAVIESMADFKKLTEIRFAKNYIDFLKKNITYKIEIPFQQGVAISKSAIRIPDLKSEMPKYSDFEVYEMKTGQILFLDKSANSQTATVYENMKGLCSENNDILSQYYKGIEEWSEKLINGDALFDYETDGFLVYPKDIPTLIKNHDLSMIESKVYVNDFYGTLYKSSKGYYVLIDEVNQENGAGNKMSVLTVRIYRDLQAVREAQVKYEQFKNKGVKSEHFYQKISDQYGKNFPSHTQELIEALPHILNFDEEQMTFDSTGMAIVDEAIHWNHSDYKLFDEWYPSVLAYYGQCYMTNKKDGKWVIRKEKDNVWTPHLVLSNGKDAFDVYEFYKALFEWPISIKEAGDWDGWQKKMKKPVSLP